MFYRRKYYLVKEEFVDIFNEHFHRTNLPNQLKHGTRFIGRWMKDNGDGTVEIFAIWEYDSYEQYIEIENNIRSDEAHVRKIQDWYEKHGGRDDVLKHYLLEVRNEAIESTKPKYTCPCCGYKTLDEEPPGSWEICDICYWEDDPLQFEKPNEEGGANQPSLRQAQQNFLAFGACDEECIELVRKPNEHDDKDPHWKPLD